MRIAKAMEGFETHLRANGCSIHTVRSYLHDLGLLAKWLRRARAPLLAEHIRPHHLDRFLTSEEIKIVLAPPQSSRRGNTRQN